MDLDFIATTSLEIYETSAIDLEFHHGLTTGVVVCADVIPGTESVERIMAEQREQYITARLIFTQALITNEATINHHLIETQHKWIAAKAMDCSILRLQ